MVEPALDNPGVARAFLRICGATVARQQLSIALALGCDRIVCIAPGVASELVELQHLAEAAGARFHVIGTHRALAGLVTATDEIFAFVDGLLITQPFATALLERGAGVIVQPIEQGLAAGFERIDMNSAAAGAMRVPGRLVAQLNDLPPDCDVFSALQRIALQAGIPQRTLPALPAEGGFWLLVASDHLAHEIEPAWIRARTGNNGRVATPGRWLVRQAVRQFGPALLDSRGGRKAILGGVAALLVLGLVAGWYGHVIVGLTLAAFAWIGAAIHGLLQRVDIAADGQIRKPFLIEQLSGWTIDGVFVALAGSGAELEPWQPELDHFFPPLMFVLVLRLAASVTGERLSDWLKDRTVLALGIGAAVASGHGRDFLHIGAILLAGLGIVALRGFKRITSP